MPPAKTEKANRALFEPADLDQDEDEIAIGLAPLRTATRAAPLSTAADLTGKTKAIFIIGRGKTGKTTLARQIGEATAAAAKPFVLADLDRTNATLASYFDGVQRPQDGDEATVARWLERLLLHVKSSQTTALIDLGGGDTTLRRLVGEVRDMVETLEQPDRAAVPEKPGIAVVALYLLGPQLDDLSPLATMEAAGFQPAATALVLNEALIETPVPREEAFARVLRHSVFRGALARGAVPVWMPRLLPAGEIEARRVGFAQAAHGVAREGRRQTPLGAFDQGRVRAWLVAMNEEFAAVRSWIS